MICIDSCMFKSWFTSIYLRSVSRKVPRPTILYFVWYFVFKQSIKVVCLCIRGPGIVDGWQNNFVFISRSEHPYIINPVIFTHDYDIINQLFWSTSIFWTKEPQWIVLVCVVCYIITHLSNSTFLILLNPQNSLLEICWCSCFKAI